MATHSSVLAWRIPGSGEPGGLLSMGSQSQTQLKRLSSSSSNQQVRGLHKQLDSGLHPQYYLSAFLCKTAWASLVAQMVKNLPAMWKTSVGYLGWEHPLGDEMATHSSILAWKIPWTEEPGGLQSIGFQRISHD